MIQFCIILLLVAASSVYANGTPICSKEQNTTSTCSKEENTTSTFSKEENTTLTCSDKETATCTCSKEENTTSTCSDKETSISYLETAMDMISKAKNKIPTCDDSSKVPMKKPLDCADVLQMDHKKSGVYVIWPVNRVTEGKHLYVYCDMETDGGGWTVIQRRGDFGSPRDFYEDWKSYKEGFGEIEKDFWLGNDNIFALTNQKLYSIRFDLEDFENNKRHAIYEKFWIADEDQKYKLQISGYSGNAGDSMAYHNKMSFSTKDQDNDGHCAQIRKGGWWYNDCSKVNLNGLYHKGKVDTEDGIIWNTWKGYKEPLAWTEMKIRPKHFRLPVT